MPIFRRGLGSRTGANVPKSLDMRLARPRPVVTLALVLAALGALGREALAGGRVDPNCYAQLDGVTPGRGRVVECTDGDPSCDNDGACNGSCDFLVRMCVNQCISPISIARLRVTGAQLELPPLPSTRAACSGYSIV